MYRILIFSASNGIQNTQRANWNARTARDEFAKVRKNLRPGQYAKLQFTASTSLPWSTMELARCEP